MNGAKSAANGPQKWLGGGRWSVGRHARALGDLGRRGLELGRRQRAREVVALGRVAAHVAQPPPGRLVLDALGDDPQAERVGEVDRRGDDRGRGGLVAMAATNERSILISWIGMRCRWVSDD